MPSAVHLIWLSVSRFIVTDRKKIFLRFSSCYNKCTFPLPKVILTYPACNKEYKATLGEDLQTLGKALARKGTYKQIADAAFRCPSLWKYFAGSATICVLKKNPSLLRKSGSDDMENCSLQKLSKE